ncbi:hypothetical protein V5799_007751, partial [Amblyomma americanum]
MASKDDEPYAGCGRGGRGALLWAALQQQARRPGTEDMPLPADDSGRSSGSSSSPDSGVSSGSHSLSPFSDSASSSSSPSVPIVGRGILLGQLMGEALSSPSPPESPTEQLAKPGRFSRGIVKAHRQSSIVPMPAEQSVIVQQRSTMQQPDVSGAARATAHTEARVEPPTAEMSKLRTKEFRGKTGKPVSVEVNYVRLGTRQGMGVFEYITDFVPVIDSKRARCKLLSSDSVLELIGRTRVFDGAKLYLPHRLRDMVTSVQTVLPTDGTSVTVHIKFVKITPPSQCMHLYNVLFKKITHCLQLTQIGRNYFDRRGAIVVPQHRLEVWPGYVQSVAEYEGGLLLNCDVSFRVLRSVTAREMLFDVYNAYPQDYKAKAVHAIVGAVVMTRYNYRTYRVDDIAWDLKPTSTFLFHNDEMITYVDYYKRIYNIEIQDHDQPLLMHRGKVRKDAPESEDARLVCLVPELCSMTGLTDELRSDFRVMKDITAHTRVSPSQRQRSLVKYVKSVKTCPAAVKVLDDWGLTLQDCALTLDGRILPEEKIMMRNKTYYHNGTADWGRLLSQDSPISTINLENWVVVFTRRDVERTRAFVAMMSKVCPSMGIQVRAPQMRELSSDSIDNYVHAIKDVAKDRVCMHQPMSLSLWVK